MLLELLAPLLIVGYVVSQRYLHRLSRYPGPFLASLSPLWKLWHVKVGDYEQVLIDLHRRHGVFVRVGPNHLDVSHPEAIKDIFNTGKSFVKSDFYDAFTALRPNIFGTRDENIHHARKKALSNGFSLQSVAQMEIYIDSCLSKLVTRLDKAAECNETIDLKTWVSFFVIDVLGELAFAESFNMLDKGREEALPPLREHVYLAMLTGQLPTLLPYFNKYLPKLPIPSLQTVVKGRAKLRNLAISCVNNRLANPDPDRRDLLAKLIAEHTNGGLEDVDVQTEAFGFIIAGSHTTATTITLLFHLLLHHPKVFAALEVSIRQSPVANHAASPIASSAPIPFNMAQSTSYLPALITETLRFAPVFTMPLLRVVPASGAVIASTPIPGGTDVSICNAVLHHDKSVFGPDADVFTPDRWLDEEYARSHKDQIFAFGAGHRACIGRNLAMVEIYKVVSTLMGRYKVLLPDGAEVRPGLPPMESFGISDLEGRLMVRLERR
ncbi:Isotrichodermin C-15 hydroxylase [Sphaceloma murrayae]|uniref:Isotrichodermin C-15 hydroxylase n=1 Tax=Sphaceloma murrayae TaxID=2082308 RepID=A0A2K1QVB8_9PEZI|nr:Isotrichodermin C-15 hydroxylase [Sphaceloma murrayae]